MLQVVLEKCSILIRLCLQLKNTKYVLKGLLFIISMLIVSGVNSQLAFTVSNGAFEDAVSTNLSGNTCPSWTQGSGTNDVLPCCNCGAGIGCTFASQAQGSSYVGLQGAGNESVSQCGFTFIAGRTYSFTIYMRNQLGYPLNNSSASSLGVYTDVNSSWELGLSLLTTVNVNSTWTQYTVSFTPTINTSCLILKANGSGNLGLDAMSNILPIELVYFEANLTNDAVELSWQTASEKNNDYFTVEKSLDGIDWKEVTKLDGAGNSSNLLTYRAIDLDPSIGLSYYRVKQTDFDGKTSYSETKSIYNFDDFIALPNPTDGIFGIGGLKHRTEKNIIVTDLMGKVIQQHITREESIQIDLSSNPSGVYLVHIDEYEPVKIVKK